MNKDQFKGSWEQFKGEFKKKWGQLTDDDLLEAEGDYEKFLGVIQKRYRDQKEDVTRWTDEWYSKRKQDEITARKATESPNQR
ncbi:MAG TPA: CsbD family protein [Candidatus Binatia bacterium]|nr:CsbD family protein [Candidatus Binatia bacterium]